MQYSHLNLLRVGSKKSSFIHNFQSTTENIQLLNIPQCYTNWLVKRNWWRVIYVEITGYSWWFIARKCRIAITGCHSCLWIERKLALLPLRKCWGASEGPSPVTDLCTARMNQKRFTLYNYFIYSRATSIYWLNTGLSNFCKPFVI